ncbi:MAG: glycosyltransferase family 2 protein [Myxococcota bacterium]|nr:glycosyltransferase family 2 protein [Myxococcota bacterium]
MRKLSIVIPSYNARALLRRTLRTLQVAAPEAEVIVVDGRSRDGSSEMVRDEFPSVRVLRHENHGFAHAINRGVEQASGEFVLLLNSDLFVSRAALESMMARLAGDHWIGAVAPVLLNEDGSRQHLFGAFYWPNFVPVRKSTRVPLLSAACLMTRRDVLREIGCLDENFFLYNEEYDWCARALRAGYQLEIVPERVVHIGGGSTSRSPELTLEAQRGFLYLAQKHAPGFVVEGLRRAMQFEGYCYSRIDPRPRHRAMWAKLESMTKRASYLESPFELSGRGTSPAQPMWPALERPAAPTSIPLARPAIAQVDGAHEHETSPAVSSASVIRIAAERLRVVSRRAPSKVAGAAG